MTSWNVRRGAWLTRPALWIFTSRSMRPTAPSGRYLSSGSPVSPAPTSQPLVCRCASPWVVCCGGIRITHTISFLAQYPDYDYYLFVEYDCVVQCSLEQFVGRAASRGADFVALPISRPFNKWHWMPYQRDVYSAEEVKLALLNVCLFSALALKMLHQRRLAMHAEPSMRSWPSSEVFVPSEIGRAGMTWLSLAEFGDVSHCDWFPPTMGGDFAAKRARYLLTSGA